MTRLLLVSLLLTAAASTKRTTSSVGSLGIDGVKYASGAGSMAARQLPPERGPPQLELSM